MKLLKWFAAASISLSAGLLSMSVSSAQSLEEIRARGSLNVGMLVDYPPYGMTDQAGKPMGYDADVAILIAEKLGVPVTLTPVTGPNRIPYLQSGKVDILVASLGITEERAQQVDFSRPYATSQGVIYGDKNLPVDSLEKLAGVSVGVARGNTPDMFLTKEAPEATKINRFDDDASVFQALLSGQVSLIATSPYVAKRISDGGGKDRFDIKFLLPGYAFGVALKPGQDELRGEINKIVDEAKSDGKLDEISQKWLGMPLPDIETPSYVK